jgi:hypothetical protein
MNFIQAHIILLDELLLIIKIIINFNLLINTKNIKFNSYNFI